MLRVQRLVVTRIIFEGMKGSITIYFLEKVALFFQILKQYPPFTESPFLRNIFGWVMYNFRFLKVSYNYAFQTFEGF